MTATSEPRLKITYATLRNDNEQLHASYDAGLAIARGELGRDPRPLHRRRVASRRRPLSRSARRSTARSSATSPRARGRTSGTPSPPPVPRLPVGPERPGSERVAIMRRMADLISERQMELAALMGDRGRQEPPRGARRRRGDGRPDPLLLRPARRPTTASTTRWATSATPPSTPGRCSSRTASGRSSARSTSRWPSPAGPSGGALVAGNTVVYKPSSDAPLCGVKLAEIADLAGLPRGVFNMVTGPGSIVGAELQENDGVDGLLFTGSYEIGFNEVFKTFSKRFPKPVVVEMGGKNPAIVSARADLEEAAEGVMRSAFGYGGQKCSACSRVYVQAPVYEAFLEALVAKTKGIAVGDPTDRKVWLGPLVNAGGAGQVRRGGRRGEARRPGRHRRRASGRPRHGPLRGADHRRRPAGRPPHLARGAVRAARRGGPVQDSRRGVQGAPTTASTA